jgi:ribonuclease J
MTFVTVIDGADTIGGNKILLEEKSRGILLDFGMNFARHGTYYQDFLKERSNRGIHDLIHLDMIPRINIYRPDLIPADINPAQWPRPGVEAVLLSHAHLDHCGNIGLLRGDIPIATSATSAAILKAMRDSAPASLGGEISYYSPKSPIPQCGGLVLESERGGSYTCRDLYLTSEPTPELRDFLSNRPGGDSKRSKGVEAGAIEPLSSLSLPFQVEPYPVDHSIPGAIAYILRGDTTIAYTGDYRIHGAAAEETRRFISAARDATVLITEGTRVGREADEEVSEENVLKNCLAATEDAEGLVVADFSARNFERLETFKEIAARTGRTLTVTAKDAYMLHAQGCADGTCMMDKDPIGIYSELKSRERIKWESEVVEKRWGGRYVDPISIRRSPEKHLICLSFFDLKHLLDIKPDGGVYIYSSSEAYSEEQEFDFQRLSQWIHFFNLYIVGFQMTGDPPKPEFVKGFHASGHLSQNDLTKVIQEIDPDKIIPIHTQHPEWFTENFENVTHVKNGVPIDLY